MVKYNIVMYSDEDGWHTVECLNLPGCISQGKTKKEALANIKDAIQGYLESLKKHPEECMYKKVEEVAMVTV